MKFGRLDNLNSVKFNLPEDHPKNKALLAYKKKRRGRKPKDFVAPQASFYVGCPVWTCEAWKGKIYPEFLPASKYFKHYARQFNSIELNSSYYAIPEKKTIDKWKRNSPDDFKFCPKVHQYISHSNMLKNVDVWIERFAVMCENFGDKLGTPFLQLHPIFAPEHMTRLNNFLKIWPNELPLAIELRNKAWYTSTDTFERLGDLLEEFRCTFVMTDTAGAQYALHQRLTTKEIFVRFAANDLHFSDYARIDAWVKRMVEWYDMGLENIWFFIHQPDEVNCPELAQYLIEKVNEQTELNVKPLTFHGQQGSLF